MTKQQIGNYQKMVEFIKKVEKHTCCLCNPESCISCNALKLLREIGEDGK